MIDPKNNMTELTVRLSVSDLAMLERIATTERRRPQDMFQLIFAAGLDCEFCDQMITVVKKEDEYSAEDRAQQKKNEELEKGDINFWDKPLNERRKMGWKAVSGCLSNHEKDDSGKYVDLLIEPLANRIREQALK
jgi:hypothetical protein